MLAGTWANLEDVFPLGKWGSSSNRHVSLPGGVSLKRCDFLLSRIFGSETGSPGWKIPGEKGEYR